MKVVLLAGGLGTRLSEETVLKPRGDGAWINGGFFVCEPGVLVYIPAGADVIWEQGSKPSDG